MNLIYIVCHDLGRHLGAYGRDIKTPALDAFAGESFRFDQAFCQTAVCSPSRAACLTGRCAHNNGMLGLSHFGWRIAPGVETVVDYLNAGGYETVHCGLSHEGEETRSRYGTDFEVSWRSQKVENAVDDAIAWLRGRRKAGDSKPFYLNLGTIEAHTVNWGRAKGDLPCSRLHTEYGGPLPSSEFSVPPPTPDIPLTRDEFARFGSSIRYLDEHLGRFLDELRRLGHYEDSLIVFTTDHGMLDWRGKNNLYDRGTEIALLMRPPGTKGEPTTVSHLVSNLDITPTLLEAAGLDAPDCLEGHSFWPLLADSSYAPNEEIFLEFNFGGPAEDYQPQRAVREDRYKLIHNFGPAQHDLYRAEEISHDFTYEQMTAKRVSTFGGYYQHPERNRPEYELFDLKNDPHEQNNLVDQPDMAATFNRLEQKLTNWMRRTDDPLLRGEVAAPPARPGFHF